MRRRSPALLPVLLFAACSGSGGSDARLAEIADELARTNDQLADVNERLFEIEERLKEIEQRFVAEQSAARGESLRELRELRRDAFMPTTSTTQLDPAKLDAGLKCEQNTCKIQRALLDEILANPALLLGAARVVPIMDNGTPAGFKLFGMRKDSLGQRLGFLNGDQLHSINDYSLATPERALEAYAMLREATKLEVAFQRRGQPQTLTIEIE